MLKSLHVADVVYFSSSLKLCTDSKKKQKERAVECACLVGNQ